jgi:hypothetical protein
MRLLARPIALGALVMALAACGGPDAPLTGTWTGEICSGSVGVPALDCATKAAITLELHEDGAQISGSATAGFPDGTSVAGTQQGDSVHLELAPPFGAHAHYDGRLAGGVMTGVLQLPLATLVLRQLSLTRQ